MCIYIYIDKTWRNEYLLMKKTLTYLDCKNVIILKSKQKSLKLAANITK